MFRWLLKSLVLEPPDEGSSDEIARFRIPANAGILKPTLPFAPTYHRSNSVERTEIRNGVGYAVTRRIDGHPDLHDYLWDRAGAEIPRECCWVIQATAALANPQTNIIFAATGGTHGVRIRLSDEHAAALPSYEVEPCSDLPGFRWIQSRLRIDDDRAMLAFAHQDSGIIGNDPLRQIS